MAPSLDTLLTPVAFCSSCTFVRRSGNGLGTWRCGGHEVESISSGSGSMSAPAGGPHSEAAAVAASDVPEKISDELCGESDFHRIKSTELHDSPLSGRSFVETFTGDPTCGGGRVAPAWVDQGGRAEKCDISIDKHHDFTKDET